jgi:hypothetical protein
VRTHCCPDLAGTTQTLHPDTPPDPARAVAHDPVFDEYRLVGPAGRLRGEPLRHCPWCGTALPASQRRNWFDAVARAGHAPDDADLPDRFTTARWRDGPGDAAPG